MSSVKTAAASSRLIRLLVIHCLDVPNGRWTTVADVDQWHRARGYSGIGYHHVIYLDGTVHDGRPHGAVGAHAKGYNSDSLGIALVGRDKYTPEQWQSLFRLVWRLADQYHIPVQSPDFQSGRVSGVVGHGELPNVAKTCPGFRVSDWIAAGLRPTDAQIFERQPAE